MLAIGPSCLCETYISITEIPREKVYTELKGKEHFDKIPLQPLRLLRIRFAEKPVDLNKAQALVCFHIDADIETFRSLNLWLSRNSSIYTDMSYAHGINVDWEMTRQKKTDELHEVPMFLQGTCIQNQVSISVRLHRLQLGFENAARALGTKVETET